MTAPLSKMIEGGRPFFRATATVKGGGIVKLFDLTDIFAGFSIKEKEYELPQARISIYDIGGVHGKLLDWGTRIDLEWGVTVETPLFGFFRPDEMRDISSRTYSRGPLTFSVVNSSATLSGGRAILELDLLAFGVSGAHEKKTRRFESGTIEQAIRRIAGEIGARAILKFNAKNNPLTRDNPLLQTNITNVAFLKNIATEKDIKLVYTHNRKTGRVNTIVFVDHAREKTINWSSLRAIRGKYHYIDYGVGNANMLENFKFSRNHNAPGGSTFIPQTGADGKIQIRILVSKREKTVIYTLNNKAIREDARRKAGKEARATIRRALASGYANFDYEKPPFKRYFIRKIVSTAPEGFGHHGRGGVLFNPLYMVGDLVWAGPSQESAIPTIFRTFPGDRENLTNYRIREQETSLGSGGWKQTLGITR